MELGSVVEFIDSQKIFCAIVMEVKNLRLRLLAENNREVKLSAGRLSHRSNLRLDASQGRDKLVGLLKEKSIRRRMLSEQIDIHELWEVLNSEQEWIDLPTMTAFCFPENLDGDHEAAVIRAFFNDRLYFRFGIDKFFPNSVEKVEQLTAQREAEARKEQIIDQGARWVQRTLKGIEAQVPEKSQEIIEILKSYYLFENDSPHADAARSILNQAGAGSPSAIFAFLLKTGIWQNHENLDLLRFEINLEMPAEASALAESLLRTPPPLSSTRQDLRDLSLITVDGPSTLDFDDALSLSRSGDLYRLGIHIADVAHYIQRGDSIDTEALARASSIYMPDQKIPMLPAVLSENACSLKAGLDRPALSTLITMNSQAEVIEFEIVPSLIRVQRQLTYHDVDHLIGSDETIAALNSIALNHRAKRLDKGALIIELPEIAVWLSPEGEPVITRIDRESPSRMMVSELMILSNELSARFLAQRNLPAIYRSQPEPRERLFERDTGRLFQNWMQRKMLNRFILSSDPQPHAGLGLPAYVTASSPIRKYTDLITQRQLKAALGMHDAYTKAEIDFLIASLEEPMMKVGRTQFRRNRYWLLKCLESRTGQKEEGLVLNRTRTGYNILLPAYMIECQLSGAENIKLKPEDPVQVVIQHASARNDVLNVYLG